MRCCSAERRSKIIARPRDGESETRWEYVRDNLAYGVPYRTLVPRGRDELWVAGRCFSATHDAHASCRSMGQTMSMGQAAGVAAVAVASRRLWGTGCLRFRKLAGVAATNRGGARDADGDCRRGPRRMAEHCAQGERHDKPMPTTESATPRSTRQFRPHGDRRSSGHQCARRLRCARTRRHARRLAGGELPRVRARRPGPNAGRPAGVSRRGRRMDCRLDADRRGPRRRSAWLKPPSRAACPSSVPTGVHQPSTIRRTIRSCRWIATRSPNCSSARSRSGVDDGAGPLAIPRRSHQSRQRAASG